MIDELDLDRRAELRTKPDLMAAERAHPEARFALVWRGKSLLDGQRPAGAVWLPMHEAPEGIEIYLGRDGEDAPRFAVDVSPLEDVTELAATGRFSDLMRAGLGMDLQVFRQLGYARGMAHWHRSAVRCERCGGEMMAVEAGFKRVCTDCGNAVFPRSDPAVMILVTYGDQCLLARQPRFPPGMYSALAGFVEPGESLEACVLREAKEEVGLDVTQPRYFGSQPWPFPQSLMVGFEVQTASTEIVLDQDELEDARWVSRDELRNPEGFFYPPPLSLAHFLIRDWLDRG